MVWPLQNDRAASWTRLRRKKQARSKSAKVNVDDNHSLSARYNIRAIPTLLFFKDGQVRDQVTRA